MRQLASLAASLFPMSMGHLGSHITRCLRSKGGMKMKIRSRRAFVGREDLNLVTDSPSLAYLGGTVLLPDGLAYEQAAPIMCAGYTVWGGLRRANPQPGERVAVVGIGGLGHLAIQ